MNAVAPKVKQGITATGEPLEITLYQVPGEVEISPGIPGVIPPLFGPAPPLAVSGWYGKNKELFEVWRLNGEYVNPATGQHGPAIRDALPAPVAKGRW